MIIIARVSKVDDGRGERRTFLVAEGHTSRDPNVLGLSGADQKFLTLTTNYISPITRHTIIDPSALDALNTRVLDELQHKKYYSEVHMREPGQHA